MPNVDQAPDEQLMATLMRKSSLPLASTGEEYIHDDGSDDDDCQVGRLIQNFDDQVVMT